MFVYKLTLFYGGEGFISQFMHCKEITSCCLFERKSVPTRHQPAYSVLDETLKFGFHGQSQIPIWYGFVEVIKSGPCPWLIVTLAYLRQTFCHWPYTHDYCNCVTHCTFW
jgi:hypothetical protein